MRFSSIPANAVTGRPKSPVLLRNTDGSDSVYLHRSVEGQGNGSDRHTGFRTIVVVIVLCIRAEKPVRGCSKTWTKYPDRFDEGEKG